MDDDDPAHPLEYLIVAAIIGGALVYGAFGAVTVLINVLAE